jgi:hypothetical protein
LDNDTLVPVSGVREDVKEPGVSVPMEGKKKKKKKKKKIQQRSPTIKGKRQEFIDHILSFASQFSQVVILTSMDASRRLDSQINGPPFRVLGEGEYTVRSVTLGIPVLENIELEASQEGDKEHKLHLPGSGLARQLYEQLQDKVPTTLLIMFALEGGNIYLYLRGNGIQSTNCFYI